MKKYSPPIDKLLTCGEAHFNKWPDYSSLGLSNIHIPELIRMIGDNDLHFADSEGTEIWAPVHAWRILGQLRAAEAVIPLLEQLYLIDEEQDDWVCEEFPEVFSMIGPAAVVPLGAFLKEQRRGLWAKVCAASSLEKIGNRYSEERDQCVELLIEQMKQFRDNDPTLNGFIISSLTDLKAQDSMETIREAYNEGCVDCTVMGDIEDAEIAFGTRKERSSPPLKWQFNGGELPQHVAGIRKDHKVGRNEPCPCGSGKKYKKCCLNTM